MGTVSASSERAGRPFLNNTSSRVHPYSVPFSANQLSAIDADRRSFCLSNVLKPQIRTIEVVAEPSQYRPYQCHAGNLISAVPDTAAPLARGCMQSVTVADRVLIAQLEA
ncbi:hypothetical protein CSAL01_11206 [Colletotrichum salicis]|uniref:Uncharacterized protein n=1 Tax=Colletotrichum salicis TaxID=1209931 RepID=A0A135UGJ4_9PEZI|nr:hypothetical protein CSAL01_11206 [Colletotrichum salicis]